MVQMKNLRRTTADVKAEKTAMGAGRKGESVDVYVPPEDEGARMEFEHHHLMKMGLGGKLKSGQEVEFHGKGSVERSESRSTPEGERHSATVRFHHGGADGDFKGSDGDEERMALRSDLEKAHGKSEEKAGSVKNAKQVPEKAGK